MAKSKDYLDWISPLEESDPSFLYFLMKEFLIKSPALDVSVRSNGWITRFGVNDSDDAEVLFDTLTEGINCFTSKKSRYANSASEVERLLRENRCLTGPFWIEKQFAVYTIPNDVKSQVGSAIDTASKSNAALKGAKRKLIKDKYLQMDALFRHIRNSLAHGSFQPRLIDERHKVCIFQDSSVSGDLSARIVLKEETLRKWTNCFQKFEKEGV